jgi:toxin-antitoxin system PIN domain toxin
MSFAIDANILLYASDADNERNAPASAFLRRCAEGTEVFYVAWITVMAYVRIATHPHIFRTPLSPDTAMRNVEELLAIPMCQTLSEEEGFWRVYASVAQDVAAKGNLVPDAHLAALLRQHGIKRLYTYDRDFRKFAFLDVCELPS